MAGAGLNARRDACALTAAGGLDQVADGHGDERKRGGADEHGAARRVAVFDAFLVVLRARLGVDGARVHELARGRTEGGNDGSGADEYTRTADGVANVVEKRSKRSI